MKSEIGSVLHATLISVLIAISSGCVRSPINAWTPDLIDGKNLEAKDADGQSSYEFEPNGIVSVSSMSADGALVAPLFEWRIVDGRLLVYGSGFSEELTLLSASATKIKAKWKSGKVVEFRVRNDG